MNRNSEPFHLHFHAVLKRSIEDKRIQRLHLTGSQSPVALAAILSEQLYAEDTHLVLVPDGKTQDDLGEAIRFFRPDKEVHRLGAYDVSPYSGLYPSSRLIAQRMAWLENARQPGKGAVFIATAKAVSQFTLPVQVFDGARILLKPGSNLPPEFSRTLSQLGYQSAPIVEDVSQFAVRGGIIDFFAPSHNRPYRLSLFGDQIESIRSFDPKDQGSLENESVAVVIPCREVFFAPNREDLPLKQLLKFVGNLSASPAELDDIVHNLRQRNFFPGIDFLLPFFYEHQVSPIDFFPPESFWLWQIDPSNLQKSVDENFGEHLKEFRGLKITHLPTPEKFFAQELYTAGAAMNIEMARLLVHGDAKSHNSLEEIPCRTSPAPMKTVNRDQSQVGFEAARKAQAFRSDGNLVFIGTHTLVQAKRISIFLQRAGLEPSILQDQLEDESRAIHAPFDWSKLVSEQRENKTAVHIILRATPESIIWPEEQVVFLRDDDFLGRRQHRREKSDRDKSKLPAFALSDLNPGDRIVHDQHGIGIYEGLKVMGIEGADAEFIQLCYKDGDKLYLPIYRISQIHRYGGASTAIPLDKLGGTQWNKVKSKVRDQLRDLAGDLLKLYALRSQMQRPSFSHETDELDSFADGFAYDETEDQQQAINDIFNDMASGKPMDRLVCGDVGFGKTEVAMRAAFHAVQSQRQVAVLAPTTVLCFQHLDTFQRRFKGWPVRIGALNRLVSAADAKKIVSGAKQGELDIVIGTHRLLSKDIEFKNLGLLIVDEEQRFGVIHKEKIRRLRTSVDTLTLSATPIPRTLNMSLVGMRDLSLINTPPIDRLPIRTFVCRYDEDTIRRAVESELKRGGQVFFIHNRVQSIYGVADELRSLLPHARLRVGHGQMQENELEETMVAFYKHEIDILLCTTIIESGIDNPRANTMIIDNAHTFGLSQLYQLRGRVGRSKDRAYCYLLVPQNTPLQKDAQERLKIIQENSALGSGIRIAQHDLELRGAGDILGDEQSGNIDAVGYEMYLELLEQALAESRGEPLVEQVEPEINVRVPALIPPDYVPDLRLRLSIYRSMTDVADPAMMDQIEQRLRDQFGPPPEPVINLMGLMLIRHHCRELGIRDLSASQKSVSLAFTASTPLPANQVVQLAQHSAEKFAITPDMRLIVRLQDPSWTSIYEELLSLRKLCPKH